MVDEERVVDNPFGTPSFENDRGLRRLVNNTRKAMTELRESIKKGDENADSERTNELRANLVKEISDLRLHFPDPNHATSVTATLTEAEGLLRECPEPVSEHQAGTNVADRGLEIDLTEPNDADENPTETENAGPSGCSIVTVTDPTAEMKSAKDRLFDAEQKLFESEQRVLDVEEELEVEKRRHARECADLRMQFDRDRVEMNKEFSAREAVLQKRIDELADALVDAQNELQRTESASTARYSWVEGVGFVPNATARNPVTSQPSRQSPSTVSGFPTTASAAPAPGQSGLRTNVMTAQSAPVTTQMSNATFVRPTASVSTPSAMPQPEQDAAISLLTIQTQSHAYNMLTQKRPRHTFTGDNRKIDFDAYLSNCKALMNIPGATDAMKLAELPFWFSGTAGLVVDRFTGEQDAEQALADAFHALKKEFGRKKLTAKQMMTELLQGEKVPERNHAQIKTLILNLEKVYKTAVETHREQSFDLPETINDVIRCKLPHLAGKWAKKIADIEMNDDRGDAQGPSFLQFLTFVKKQNNISLTMGEILKSPEQARLGSTPKPTVRISANSVATTPSRPDSCTLCPGAAHRTAECRKFAGYSQAEKAKKVREKRLCTCCLGFTSATHKAINCATKKGCDHCGERHHTLLHGISYRDLRSDAGGSRGSQPL